MKRNLIICIFVCFAVLLTVSIVAPPVQAASFGGGAKSDYVRVSPPTSKTNSKTYTTVQWVYSDRSSHNMWFGLYSGDTLINQALLKYRTTASFPTYANYGSTYHLRARREHIINPLTYVSGTWIP